MPFQDTPTYHDSAARNTASKDSSCNLLFCKKKKSVEVSLHGNAAKVELGDICHCQNWKRWKIMEEMARITRNLVETVARVGSMNLNRGLNFRYKRV